MNKLLMYARSNNRAVVDIDGAKYLVVKKGGRLGAVGKGEEPRHGPEEIAWAPLLVEDKRRLDRRLKKKEKDFSYDQAWA